MGRGWGSQASPPSPKGRGGVGFLLKSMISVSNPCYGAPPERFPSGEALEAGLLPQTNHSLKESVCHIES